MAKDKNSFIMYRDWRDIFFSLKPSDAGKLIQHIYAYVSDENPTEPTGSILIAWIPIKAQLKRDLKKWESYIVQKSAAGKASANKRQRKQRALISVERTSTGSTEDVNVNDNVNVSNNIPAYVNGHGFEIFWKMYPKKKSKGTAEKAWKGIRPDEKLLQTIINSIEHSKNTDQWKKEGGQFIPYPATWLRAKGWEDESIVEIKPKTLQPYTPR